MRTRPVLAISVSLTLAIVLGWSTLTVDAQKPLKLRLAVHGSLMGAPDVIAVREGYFKEVGLDVDWRRFALGKEGRDAMIAGAIDVNATAPTPFMIGLDKGVPYTAIGVNSMICSANHIVVLKSSDVNSVGQLRGKKIGLPKGTITEYVFMTRIAPSFGLKPEDFQVANIPDPKDEIPSLVAKAIDMATLGEPHTAIGEKDGTVRIIENFCKYDPLPFMLTATNKIIQEHPDAVVAYLRAWLRAIKLVKDDPKKAATIYAEEQRSLGRTVDTDVIVTALGRMRWEPDLTPEIEKYLVDQAKDLAAPATGKRVINAVPNVAKALNRDLLAKARAAR
jgi:ABC-type nitrate/sulfonate/bicarbonate transport system substrate-binding protein